MGRGCAPASLFRAAGTTAQAASTRWHGISGTVSPSTRLCATRSLHPGISLLGGEPFEPENQRELLPFVRNFRALYPNKSVWCYSGYTWEQLTGSVPCPARCEVTDELLSLLDVLVDGRFVEAQHDISLRFRGSSNQRLLDVPKSLAAKAPVWWEDEQVFATHTM